MENAIGNRLREVRKSKGLTMKQLAEKVGTSLEYVHEIETGKGKPSMSMLEKFTKALDLNMILEHKTENGGD